METDDTKLWRLTRQLNDEGTRQSKVTLLQGETMVYGKQAADMFANTYKEASDITVLPYQQAEVRKEQRNIREPCSGLTRHHGFNNIYGRAELCNKKN